MKRSAVVVVVEDDDDDDDDDVSMSEICEKEEIDENVERPKRLRESASNGEHQHQQIQKKKVSKRKALPIPEGFKQLFQEFKAIDSVLSTARFQSLVSFEKVINGVHDSFHLEIQESNIILIHSIWSEAFMIQSSSYSSRKSGKRRSPSSSFIRITCNFNVPGIRSLRGIEFKKKLLLLALQQRNSWASSNSIPVVNSLDSIDHWDIGFVASIPILYSHLTKMKQIQRKQQRQHKEEEQQQQNAMLGIPQPMKNQHKQQQPQQLLLLQQEEEEGVSVVVEQVKQRIQQMEDERNSANTALLNAKRDSIVSKLPQLFLTLRQSFMCDKKTRVSIDEAALKLSLALIPKLSSEQVKARIELICKIAPELVHFIDMPPSLSHAISESTSRRKGKEKEKEVKWIEWPEKLPVGAIAILQKKLAENKSLLENLTL